VQRAKHIAAAMASELPERFEDAQPILLAALGPESKADDGITVPSSALVYLGSRI